MIREQVTKGELPKIVSAHSWEHISLIGANRQMRDWDPIEIHTKRPREEI